MDITANVVGRKGRTGVHRLARTETFGRDASQVPFRISGGSANATPVPEVGTARSGSAGYRLGLQPDADLLRTGRETGPVVASHLCVGSPIGYERSNMEELDHLKMSSSRSPAMSSGHHWFR
jgi:hypothetical protein